MHSGFARGHPPRPELHVLHALSTLRREVTLENPQRRKKIKGGVSWMTRPRETSGGGSCVLHVESLRHLVIDA